MVILNKERNHSMSLRYTSNTKPQPSSKVSLQATFALFTMLVFLVNSRPVDAQNRQDNVRFSLTTSALPEDTISIFGNKREANLLTRDELEERLAKDNTIRWIDVIDCDLSEPADILGDINLQQRIGVSFYGCKIDSESLRKLVGPLKVHSLQFSNCNFTDKGTLYLCEKYLKYICIERCNIDTITDPRLSDLPKCAILSSVYLGDIHINELTAVATSAPLVKLEFHRCSLDDKCIENIRNRNVESLSIDGCKLSEQQLQSVAKIDNLQRLYLSRESISVAFLNALGRAPILSELYIVGSSLNNEHTKSISTFKHLKILQLQNCDLSDKSIEPIALLQTLNSVDINFNPDIGNKGVLILAGLNNLKNIHVVETSVTEQGILDFARKSPARTIVCSKITISEKIHELVVDHLGTDSAYISLE